MAKRKTIRPAGDLVLVRDIDRETTVDGISLPDNVKQQDMVFGIVVKSGREVAEITKPQDTVVYGPYAGKPVLLDGIEFRLMRNGQIEGYIEDVEEE